MPTVCRIEGWVVRVKAVDHRGWFPGGAATPRPLPARELVMDLCIESGDGGYFLLWKIAETSPSFPGSETRGGDSWHESVEDAKRQAELEFGVPLDRWEASS